MSIVGNQFLHSDTFDVYYAVFKRLASKLKDLSKKRQTEHALPMRRLAELGYGMVTPAGLTVNRANRIGAIECRDVEGVMQWRLECCS